MCYSLKKSLCLPSALVFAALITRLLLAVQVEPAPSRFSLSKFDLTSFVLILRMWPLQFHFIPRLPC